MSIKFDRTDFFFEREDVYFDNTQVFSGEALPVTAQAIIAGAGFKSKSFAEVSLVGGTSLETSIASNKKSSFILEYLLDTPLEFTTKKTTTGVLPLTGISTTSAAGFKTRTSQGFILNGAVGITSTGEKRALSSIDIEGSCEVSVNGVKVASGIASSATAITVTNAVFSKTVSQSVGDSPVASGMVGSSGYKNPSQKLSARGFAQLSTGSTRKAVGLGFSLVGTTITEGIGSKTSINTLQLEANPFVSAIAEKKVGGVVKLRAKGIVTTFFSRYIQEWDVSIFNEELNVGFATQHFPVGLVSHQEGVEIEGLYQDINVNTFSSDVSMNTQTFNVNIEKV